MRLILLFLLVALHCHALEFAYQPIQYITNSYHGITRVYRIDLLNTNATGKLLCTSGECTVNFARAIELADRHIRATYPTRRDTGFEAAQEGLVVECRIFRFGFGQNWCYVIKISPRENIIGLAKVLEIPVLMDGTIPMMDEVKPVSK